MRAGGNARYSNRQGRKRLLLWRNGKFAFALIESASQCFRS